MEVKKPNTLENQKSKLEFCCNACGTAYEVKKSSIPKEQIKNWLQPVKPCEEPDCFTPIEIKRNWILICIIYINWTTPCCSVGVKPLIDGLTKEMFFNWYFENVRPRKTNGFLKAMRDVRARIDKGLKCYMTHEHNFYFVYNENEACEDSEEFIKMFEYIDPDQIPSKQEPVKHDFVWWCKRGAELVFIFGFFYLLAKFISLWP